VAVRSASGFDNDKPRATIHQPTAPAYDIFFPT